MGNCRELEPQLTAYVDGEVDETERHRLETHLQRCAPCRSRVASERATHDLLVDRRDRLRGCAPASLRQRCVTQCAMGSGARGVLGRRMLVPLSLAASLAAAALFFMFGWGSSVETYAAQLADDHIQCFRSPPSAASVDAGAAAQSWLAANGWPLKVAPSAEKEGLQLLGVRRCGSPRGYVAHVLYRWWDEPVSVYVLNGTVDDLVEATGSSRAAETIATHGERAVMWTSRGRTYAVVARSQAAGIERVTEYIRTSTE